VERLVETARGHLGKSAEEVIDGLFEDLARWSGDAPAQDDCTVVVVVYPAVE
jgi:serine phosphatase RsbU (regulator of sigma subunit)